MSFKSQLNHKYWNDSKQIFFTPKFSLQGHNLFPQINQVHAFSAVRDQPFLNILKKPIMNIYDRAQVRSEKKPVCIVGMPKEVEIRHVRTANIKKNKQQIVETSLKNNIRSTFSQHLTKTESEISQSPSKLLVPISNPPPQGSHYYLLGPGNNKQIVEKVLQKRQGWFPTTNSIFHFRWEQARPKFQNLLAPHRQVINHLPGHEVISDKGRLLTHLKTYCQKSQEFMFRIVPASFIIDFKSQNVEEQLKRFITFFVEISTTIDLNPENYGLKSSNISARKKAMGDLVTITDDKKNALKNTKYSPNKSSKFRIEQPLSPDLKRKEEIKKIYKNLITQLKPYYTFQDMSSLKKDNPWVTPNANQIYGDTCLWLLKPSDLNRGRGIKLFRNVEELGQILKTQLQKQQEGSFVVQKYIEKPLLIEGRKFDIRVWALVTQTRQLFFFQQGYIRLCSEQYVLESSSLLAHLTNNAIQKNGTSFGEFQQGNILPLSYLSNQEYLQKDQLLGQIKRKIVHTIKAAGSKLYQPTQKNQSISVGNMAVGKPGQSKMKYFEIFGYDFMIDIFKDVWLIEVNTNPCLQLSNKWLKAIVPRMLDDAFKLTLDRMFTQKSQEVQYPVEGYSNNFNMWEYLDVNNAENPSTIF